MFIKRIHSYAVKSLKSGAARIYIQNSDCLRQSNLPENTPVRIKYMKNRIEIVADKNGDNKIMDTGRGALLELKNKKTAKSIGAVDKVTATFRSGKVIITLHYHDKQRIEREKRFINSLVKGSPLRSASFFSGLGMLSYHLKQGLEEAGIESEICFANDSSSEAMECNLAANPIWEKTTRDAVAIVDELGGIDISELPQSDYIEIGYPCVGQSSLCSKENRDLNHPLVGTLFIKLISALEKMNAAVVVFENTPAFRSSKTLEFIKREMKGYRFEDVTLNSHDFGEIETRKRACIIAVSEGLPHLNLSHIYKEKTDNLRKDRLSDFLEDIPIDSGLWKKMEHIKRKNQEKSHNYRNTVYLGDEEMIGTITASYAAPKAGTPMIAHPVDPELQRQITPTEHAGIRKVPEKMFDLIEEISTGKSHLVTSRGSKSLAHRLLGNGVSKNVWNVVGRFLGNYFIKCRDLIHAKQLGLFAV